MNKNRPFTVGFAAETRNVLDYARQKLLNKKLDMICANDVSKPNSGFNSNQNAITLIWPLGELDLPVQPKQQLAEQLIALISQHYHALEKKP